MYLKYYTMLIDLALATSVTGLTISKCKLCECAPGGWIIRKGIHRFVGITATKTPIESDTPIIIIKNVKFNPPDESPEYRLKNPLTPK